MRGSGKPARQSDELLSRRPALQLVDRRAPDFSLHADLGPHGRHEDDIAGLQPGIRPRVATQQQVVKIQRADRPAVALVLDPAQRADRLDASAGKQCMRDGRETAHHVRTGTIHVAEHEHAYGAQLPHRDARADADHLLADAILKHASHLVETEARDLDRAELWEVDGAVAIDDQRVVAARFSE